PICAEKTVRMRRTPVVTTARAAAMLREKTSRIADHTAATTALMPFHADIIRFDTHAAPAATVVLIHSHACRIHPTTAFHAAIVNAFTLSQLAMINATSATTAMMISPIGPIAISHAAAIFAAAMSDWMPMRTHPATTRATVAAIAAAALAAWEMIPTSHAARIATAEAMARACIIAH